MTQVSTYNPSPFGVPAAWTLRVDPFFYGGVTEMEGGWYGARSADPRVPKGGPFDRFEQAREWVVDWCRDALQHASKAATERALRALDALADLDEEFE